jgi:hypothetical protein
MFLLLYVTCLGILSAIPNKDRSISDLYFEETGVQTTIYRRDIDKGSSAIFQELQRNDGLCGYRPKQA